ncbi:hypothetical protein AHiyo4_08570 [Arthrobacter sp. Hiyo4]|nr:hypothetical protein AHiyo4_08570 [Arthrobacter sp. Hiyo4]
MATDWLVMSTSMFLSPIAAVTAIMLVSTSRAPAPYRNMVSARCREKSRVLRAEVSTPPTWIMGLA